MLLRSVVTLAVFCVSSLLTFAREPVPVIFDTDITGDVDDVLALAMLHTLADRGECELVAVTVSKINPLTGRFVDAVNTFYGRPTVPIGVTHDAQVRESKYLSLIETVDGDRLRYPHDVRSNDELPDAVRLLRQQLVAADDHFIVIIQVGLASNLAALVVTGADDVSPWSGFDLVQRKVRLVSVMAGAFVATADGKNAAEANVRNGIESMRTFADRWPESVPVVWSEFEIGSRLPYPRESIRNDFGYREHHIVREAYLLHSGPEHDRPTWDLTSVLYAVRPDHGYFGLSDSGLVTVSEKGITRWESGSNQRDRLLRPANDQQPRVLESLQQLVSQPPKH